MVATATKTTTAPAASIKNVAAYNANPSYNGATLTFGQIEALWIKANPTQALWAPLMAGIALAESGGRTGALNDAGTTTGASADYSVGLWQINYLGSMLQGRTAEYGSPGYLQQNPLAQAQAAGALLGNGAGISNWEGDPVGQYFMSSSTPPSVTQVTSVLSQQGRDTTDAFDPSTVSQAQLTGFINSIPVVGSIAGGIAALAPGDIGSTAIGVTPSAGITSWTQGLEDIEGWLINPSNWDRIGQVIGGGILVIVGLAILVSGSKAGQEIESAAPLLAA
jgi:hypothetical protein